MPITIDTALCKKDGLCTMVCPESIFFQKEKGTVPVTVHPEECIGCGQCAAICPAMAVQHPRYPKEKQFEIKPELMASADQIVELLKNRRSMRALQNKPVEREQLEKILEVARFAPSARNTQTTQFMVVQDKSLLKKIVELTVEFQKQKVSQSPQPIPVFSRLIKEFGEGKDQILHDAPVLLFFHADPAGIFPEVNASLSLQNATLMTSGLGLACYYAGYIVDVCQQEKQISQLLALPENHKIYGALAIGYPKLKFKRRMERNPAKITWK